MQNTYELMVLLHPDLEIDVEAPIAKVEALIEDAGGRVVKRDNWGKKRLAYRIKRQDFAIYVYFEINLDATKVRQLENTILITEEVLRHILVVHEESQPRTDKKGEKKAEAKTDKSDDKAEDKVHDKTDKSDDKAEDKAEKAEDKSGDTTEVTA
jgi:small subunit ribosomal protein S6